jgi:hypothetical protein
LNRTTDAGRPPTNRPLATSAIPKWMDRVTTRRAAPRARIFQR